MPENVTDISDLGWDDLAEDTEYDILRELASERDGVNGNGSTEEIAAQLLDDDGRAGEVPDEYAEYVDGDEYDVEVVEAAGEAQSVDEDASVKKTDDTAPDDEGDTDDGETDGATRDGSNKNPREDASFIVSAGTITSWLDPINALVDECKVHLNPDGLRTRAVDPSNVGMVDAALDASGFESYDVPSPGVIGINCNRLDDVLSGANADDLLNIAYDAAKRNLVVEYGGHTFTVALINPDSIRQEPDLPDLDLPAKIEVPSDRLATAIGNANQITDHVGLRATGDGALYVNGEGDTDAYECELTDDDAAAVSYPEGEVYSLFSLDYLTGMTGAVPKGEGVTVRLGDEFPTHLIFDVDGEASGEVTYMLAPRISSD